MYFLLRYLGFIGMNLEKCVLKCIYGWLNIYKSNLMVFSFYLYVFLVWFNNINVSLNLFEKLFLYGLVMDFFMGEFKCS